MKIASEITAHIKPNYIVLRTHYIYTHQGRKRVNLSYYENFKKKKGTGIMSQTAQKKIRTAINWLVHSAREKLIFDKKTKRQWVYKIGFITLTIPFTGVPVSIHFAKSKLLNSWITYCRKYYGLKNYVWKVELTKQQQPHIHITTDTFIHYQSIRESWNRILANNNLLDEFAQCHYHYNPNSTDVHSVKKVKDLAAYVSKYMAKNATDNKIQCGKLWSSNYELSRAYKLTEVIPIDQAGKQTKWLMNPDIMYKEITTKPPLGQEPIKLADLYLIDQPQWNRLGQGQIKESYQHQKTLIRNHNLQPTIINI